MDKTYDVKREHEGDRFYRSGDERVLDEAEAAHLVRLGVLEPKAEKPAKNKAEQPAKNKAD